MSAAVIEIALRAQLIRHGHAIDFTDRNLDLRQDVGADELDICTIAMDLEEQLGIELPDHDFDAVATIGDLHTLVETKLQGRLAA